MFHERFTAMMASYYCLSMDKEDLVSLSIFWPVFWGLRRALSPNQSPRGIIWSAVPLPCFIQFLGQNWAVAGQRPIGDEVL